MSRALLVLAALLAGAAVASAAAGEVIAIKGTKQFEKVVKKHPFIVVEFYAPWCGHCKRLEPEYDKAAAQLKSDKIVLAKVDATEDANKELASRFNVAGFPTLKIFRNGDTSSPSDYEGPREADGIVKYLRKQTQPAVVALASKDALKAFLKDNSVAALGFFAKDSGKGYEAFAKVANSLRNDVSFGWVSKKALLADAFKGKSVEEGFVGVVKEGEEEQPVFEGKLKESALKSWVESASIPLVIEFSDDPAKQKLFGKVWQSTDVKVFALAKTLKKEVKKALRAAAKANSDLKFVESQGESADRLLQYFGVAEADLPALLVFDTEQQAKYLRRSFKAADIPEFLKEYQDGALEKYIRSEEPPADNSGPVTVVTAKTFDSIVFGGKDVFIEFYAPWCGHCKNLAPTWEELGEYFKENEDVVIAKLDATANDVPSTKIKVQGFPTLIFVSKDGNVIPYDGARAKDDFISFIKKNSAAARDQEEPEGKDAEEEEEEEEESEEHDEL